MAADVRGDDRTVSGGSLPPGYIERAAESIAASADPGRILPDIPFKSCPGCGARLSDPASFVQEYWVADETRFMVWCHGCRGTYTVVPVRRYVGSEATE